MRYFYTGDRQTTQGPLVDTDNCLTASTNGTTQVSTATGAAIVNGHAFVSSEIETWDVTAPANRRMDIIALLENNTNAAVAGATAGPGLPFLFPIGAATGEYTAALAVPPYSARLVIYQGTDGGAYTAPTLDTTPAKFAIELARYNIINTPPVSIHTLVNKQEWAVTPTASVQRIEQKVLAAATGSVTFAAIPQCFSHLRIVAQTRSDKAVVLSDLVHLQFNGDAGANYDYIRSALIGNNTHTIAAIFATTFIRAQDVAAAGAPANYADMFTIDIANYRRTTFYKSAISSGANIAGAAVGSTTRDVNAGWWRNTAAITSITLSLPGDNFLVGSVFTLYGLT